MIKTNRPSGNLAKANQAEYERLLGLVSGEEPADLTRGQKEDLRKKRAHAEQVLEILSCNANSTYTPEDRLTFQIYQQEVQDHNFSSFLDEEEIIVLG
jgi:hypothetical protein